MRTGHVADIVCDNLELRSMSAAEIESKPYQTRTGFGKETRMNDIHDTKSKSLPDNTKIGCSSKVDVVSVSESNIGNVCRKLTLKGLLK